MDNKFDISEFLSKHPCYKSRQISTSDMWKLSSINEIKVDLFCQKCKAEKTFLYQGYDVFDSMDLWRNKNRKMF